MNKLITQRLTSETPPFWKKVRNWTFFGGLVVAGLTQGIATAGITIPPLLATILTIIGSACSVVGGGYSQYQTSDQNIKEIEVKMAEISNDPILTRKEKRKLKREFKNNNNLKS